MNCLCHCATAIGSRPHVQWSAGRDMIRLESGETARCGGTLTILGGDARLFELYPDDEKGAAAFLAAATHYGVGNEASALIDYLQEKNS